MHYFLVHMIYIYIYIYIVFVIFLTIVKNGFTVEISKIWKKLKSCNRILSFNSPQNQCKLHIEVMIWVQLTSICGLTLRSGFLSKKLEGRSSKPLLKVGIIGKSSWLGTWWNPTVYHTTMSLFSISLFLHLYHKIYIISIHIFALEIG